MTGGGAAGMATPLTESDESDLDEQLNAPITPEDVQCAFKRLKRHKAPGLDGVKAEYLLDAQDMLLQPLACTFNQMLHSGVPESWCEGVIHPIFKSGDEDDPGNYRGITVTAVLAKLFVMVLEKRMSCWAEAKQLRASGQAGFRKDYRTVDNMFIMNTLIEMARTSEARSSFAALSISARHLTRSLVTACGRCLQKGASRVMSLLHSNQCMRETKHVC